MLAIEKIDYNQLPSAKVLAYAAKLQVAYPGMLPSVAIRVASVALAAKS